MLSGATGSLLAWVLNASIPTLMFGAIVIWDKLGNPHEDPALAAVDRCCRGAARVSADSAPEWRWTGRTPRERWVPRCTGLFERRTNSIDELSMPGGARKCRA